MRVLIADIGHAQIGRREAIAHALSNLGHDICIMHPSEIDMKREQHLPQNPFILKAHPPIEKPFIDKNMPVFNAHKHKISCDKNRRLRKRKRR